MCQTKELGNEIIKRVNSICQIVLASNLPEDVYIVSLPESLKKPLEPAESREDLAEDDGDVTTSQCLGVS